MTENPRPGAVAIVTHARKTRDQTVQKIERAKRNIELDIEKHQGIYPHSTRVTQAEVCRRAGVGAMTLQKEQHRQTRDDLKAWLFELQKKMSSGSKVVRRAVTDRISEYKQAYHDITQAWHEAELNYVEQAVKLEQAKATIQELKTEITKLETEIAALDKGPGTKVVSITKGRQSHDPKSDRK